MILKDQLGELFIVGFQGAEIQPGSSLEYELMAGKPGGVILFDRSLSGPEKGGNIRSPEQLRELTSSLRDLCPTPLFICVDQEGGLVQRLNSSNGFFDIPTAEEMGSKNTTHLVRTEALRTAKNLCTSGINVTFSPVVDLNINPGNPIIGRVKRSFSSDPERVIRCAEEWISCHKEHNIVSCPKHFPGHGSSTSDSHLGFVDISTSWDRSELLPYRYLISRKIVDMVMVGHLYNKTLDPDFPATLSPLTVTGILRQQLGYDRVVVTDDLQMKAISDRYGFAEAICRSLLAGIDMIVIGNNLDHNETLLTDAIEAVWSGMESGLVPEETVSAALTRIRHLKLSITG